MLILVCNPGEVPLATIFCWFTSLPGRFTRDQAFIKLLTSSKAASLKEITGLSHIEPLLTVSELWRLYLVNSTNTLGVSFLRLMMRISRSCCPDFRS